MDWYEAVNVIEPYIVKIETPGGHGTGFLCFYNNAKTLCGIATAQHVVADADKWRQPIRLAQMSSNQTAFVEESNRVIIPREDTDSAVILVSTGMIGFPDEMITMLAPTSIRILESRLGG